MKVSTHSLIWALVWILIATTSIAGQATTGDEAKSAPEFHLKGILVSNSNRSVLVNRSVAREGDSIAGVKIISISEGEVLIEKDSRQIAVRVGFTGVWDHPSSPPPILQSTPDTQYGPVKRGETLSQIAEQNLFSDISLNQMMIALYEENPQAFAGNINALREGAFLRVPNNTSLQRQEHETATAEVTRQTDAWRTDRQQPIQVAKMAEPKSYGPVVWGETLSDIAARISPADTSMNEMMIALYDANPQAFSGNIDVLREGAVLRIPDGNTLHLHARNTSSAYDYRQANSGWYDHNQPLQLVSADGHGTAIFDVNLDRSNVAFPIKNFE